MGNLIKWFFWSIGKCIRKFGRERFKVIIKSVLPFANQWYQLTLWACKYSVDSNWYWKCIPLCLHTIRAYKFFYCIWNIMHNDYLKFAVITITYCRLNSRMEWVVVLKYIWWASFVYRYAVGFPMTCIWLY